MLSKKRVSALCFWSCPSHRPKRFCFLQSECFRDLDFDESDPFYHSRASVQTIFALNRTWELAQKYLSIFRHKWEGCFRLMDIGWFILWTLVWGRKPVRDRAGWVWEDWGDWVKRGGRVPVGSGFVCRRGILWQQVFCHWFRCDRSWIKLVILVIGRHKHDGEGELFLWLFQIVVHWYVENYKRE